MFSAKFNFLKTINTSPPIEAVDPGVLVYLTMDYPYQGQPFINIVAQNKTNGTIDSKSKQGSLDYAYQGSPFYGNNLNLLNE